MACGQPPQCGLPRRARTGGVGGSLGEAMQARPRRARRNTQLPGPDKARQREGSPCSQGKSEFSWVTSPSTGHLGYYGQELEPLDCCVSEQRTNPFTLAPQVGKDENKGGSDPPALGNKKCKSLELSPDTKTSCSVAQSCQTLRPHGLQRARLPCPSPSPRVCSDSRPLSWRCHPTILSSVVPFSFSGRDETLILERGQSSCGGIQLIACRYLGSTLRARLSGIHLELHRGHLRSARASF